MEKPITVHILGRSYTLRVKPEDEALTREMAAYVDTKMTAFRKAFPKQDEVTSAVIVALALAEELFTAREKSNQRVEKTDKELDDLADLLHDALERPTNGVDKNEKHTSD